MKTMLVLNITPELEEELVDYLISTESVRGFTSYPVRGHGEQATMSIAEQVSGRRARLQFEIIMQEEAVSKLISGLADNVGKDINYWQQTISNMGKV